MIGLRGVAAFVITSIFAASSQATVLVLTSNPAGQVVQGNNGGVIVNIPGSIVGSNRFYTVTDDADDDTPHYQASSLESPSAVGLAIIGAFGYTSFTAYTAWVDSMNQEEFANHAEVLQAVVAALESGGENQ